MTVMERRSEPNVSSGYEAELYAERTDISFHDLADGRVRIQVTVHNAGPQRSPPTPMRVESAVLGAFVPWQPLARVLVPALEPGESRALSVEAPRPRPASLGDFNRVPPNKLIAAANAPEQPSRQSGIGFEAMLNLFRRGQATRRSGGALRGSLAPDLWDLLGRNQHYWAGNINVFIGRHAVERHLAKALRIYPGRTNLAMFMVGDCARRDAYAFELAGLATDWEAALYNVSHQRSLVINSSDVSIQEKRWMESNGQLIVMLATQPPSDCRSGNLEVHVTRRSCRKTAIVEFNLDPNAQGAGCYTM
jgi:hypothetical protein